MRASAFLPSAASERPRLSWRLATAILTHAVLAALANYGAFWLRFDGGAIPSDYFAAFLAGLPWLLVIRGVVFERFRLHDGVWRYASTWDLRNIVYATLLSSATFYALAGFVLQLSYPRGVVLIDALLVVFVVGGVRLAYRMTREISSPGTAPRVLIVGAGDAAAMVAREMRNNHYYGVPVGFVDDDVTWRGRYIHGVRVFGTRAQIDEAIASAKPDQVLIAMPEADSTQLRAWVSAFERYHLPIKTLPNIRAALAGRVGLDQIRPLAIEDLLQRPPVGLDGSNVAAFIRGRRVMVTGAGGSIGSELCRQVAGFGPSHLVCLDQSENGLYALETDLAAVENPVSRSMIIADVTNADRLANVFATYRPEIVFHAAAHKHVPLMEDNPCEAVKNNVGGTRLVAETAARHEVSHFILISTDKAVNPTSVMGATKRVAERIVLSLMPRAGQGTVFAAVRFGNVLGSNGSVVPLFRKQIAGGRPVTVTDPEMKRYFMLIPEAVQLVLHAASLARGGELFVLEMGEQVKIVDMARTLIRLSGLRPEVDVPIVFTGTRPGEKLYEELVEDGEVAEPSGSPHIMRVHPRQPTSPEVLQLQLFELEEVASLDDPTRTLQSLVDVVPTFSPPPRRDGAGGAPPAPLPIAVTRSMLADPA